MEALTPSLCRLVRSLGSARERRERRLFIAEGDKCVADTIDHFDIQYLIATPRWYSAHPDSMSLPVAVSAPNRDMQRISSLSTPPQVLAIYRMPESPAMADPTRQLLLLLDDIQDPGNIGTILRTADWFGIDCVMLTPGCADPYGSKAIQASMGAISRIHPILAVDGTDILQQARQAGAPVYTTDLHGTDIYSSALTPNGIVVMGNEGRGVSPALAALADRRLLIPSFPAGRPTSESLNVATATAITLSEFRRQQHTNGQV